MVTTFPWKCIGTGSLQKFFWGVFRKFKIKIQELLQGYHQKFLQGFLLQFFQEFLNGFVEKIFHCCIRKFSSGTDSDVCSGKITQIFILENLAWIPLEILPGVFFSEDSSNFFRKNFLEAFYNSNFSLQFFTSEISSCFFFQKILQEFLNKSFSKASRIFFWDLFKNVLKVSFRTNILKRFLFKFYFSDFFLKFLSDFF